MKNLSAHSFRILFCCIPVIILYVSSCKKDDNRIKFPKGTFPESTIALSGINSEYDDYNMNIHMLQDYNMVVFSSNRKSTGEQFDLVQGVITYYFNQENGDFEVIGEITENSFLTILLNTANTPGDDLGPYTFFSIADGLDYLILSSGNQNGNLDLFYLNNQPVSVVFQPPVYGPYPVSLLNSDSDDAYICFDTNQDTAYYTSDREGNFEIYLKNKPDVLTLSSWFSGEYSEGIKADSINSTGNDKCPYIFKRIMIFASDRMGGEGGYDLYYSVFRKGKWSSPVNMGPEINTQFDEYRPVAGFHEDFTNSFIIFSSDRTGGKGGFDLYFRGITFPEK